LVSGVWSSGTAPPIRPSAGQQAVGAAGPPGCRPLVGLDRHCQGAVLDSSSHGVYSPPGGLPLHSAAGVEGGGQPQHGVRPARRIRKPRSDAGSPIRFRRRKSACRPVGWRIAEPGAFTSRTSQRCHSPGVRQDQLLIWPLRAARGASQRLNGSFRKVSTDPRRARFGKAFCPCADRRARLGHRPVWSMKQSSIAA